MTIAEARLILIEHNKWRRGQRPYEVDAPMQPPHSATEIGIAIDALVKATEGMQ